MLGTGFGRRRGEDRFYTPVHLRRSMRGVDNDKLRRANSDVTARRSAGETEKPVDSGRRKPENRTVSDEPLKLVAVPSCQPVTVKQLSNLERFLQAVTPSVTARCLPKMSTGGIPVCDAEFQPYFVLGDLWESFREWSAYGAGVPLVLNDNDSVVQYYVPYLSGIQIYVATVNPSLHSRRRCEDSDIGFRDSSSDGSSDCEATHGMDRLSLSDRNPAPQDGFSRDDGESVNSLGYLIFEHFENDRPYSREPLADKILEFTLRFPDLVTLRSCDILPSSWISVAWYPIYRIPTGPTLKDLDACFLTYHSIYTPVRGSQGVQAPLMSYPNGMDGVPKISIPTFGLASYKFRGPLWNPNGGVEHQLASTLVQAAESWLSMLQVNHPDFLFFRSR